MELPSPGRMLDRARMGWMMNKLIGDSFEGEIEPVVISYENRPYPVGRFGPRLSLKPRDKR